MPLKVVLALLFVITVWGGSFPVAKLALAEISPINLATLRFTLASLLFLPVMGLSLRRTGAKLPRPAGRDLLQLHLLALLGVTTYFMVQYTAVSLTTASNAGLLIAVSPLFVALFAALFLGERLTPAKIAGIGVAMGGVAAVISRGTFRFSFGSAHLAGDLLMILNALCWALFSILGKRMMQRYSPLVTTFYITLFGTLWFYPVALPLGVLPAALRLSPAGWWAVAFLGAFCSVGGYYFWYWGLSQVEASRVAVFQYLQPLVSFALSALLLGEEANLATLGGGLLIITGVVLATRAPTAKPQEAALKTITRTVTREK
ncbi:MAG TPA: DMT family transporter [Firmicutes bacterium]|nr:DMT family transporter [Bacillota bacterium]